MAEHGQQRPERRVGRNAVIVALGVLLGVVVGVILTVTTTTTHVASSTLFVAVPAQTAGELNDGNVFAEARVQSYADVATSPDILNAVIHKTGVSMSEHTLASEVTATAPPNKVLLVLDVQDPSAKRAYRLCSALSAQVISAVNTLESDGKGKSPIRLSVVRPAQVPTSAAAPRPALYIGVAALLGLVGGVVVALALGRGSRRRDAVDVPTADS